MRVRKKGEPEFPKLPKKSKKKLEFSKSLRKKKKGLEVSEIIKREQRAEKISETNGTGLERTEVSKKEAGKSSIEEQRITDREMKKMVDRKRKKEWKSRVRTVVLVVAAGGLAVFFLLPTVLTLANSFMTSQEITANYGMIFSDSGGSSGGGSKYISEAVNLKFIPDMVSFKQYSTVLFKSPEYLLKFWNSVIYTVPILIIQIIIAILAAYSFTRFRGRLKEIVFFLYIILMLMPYQVTLVPNYLVSDWLNILDTKWSIWLPGMASPFSVFLLTKFMRRIPNSLIEAAKIDGAGEWKIFTKICVPLCKGSVYSVAILIFIDYWNMVEQPLILLSDPEMHPLSVFLSKINSGEISLAFAVASIYMIPSILVFLYGEEYLVEGISYSGGLKG